MSSDARPSPGDFDLILPAVPEGNVEAAVTGAAGAFETWRTTPLERRIELLRIAQAAITQQKDSLARGIAIEIGKPITEALGELGAVVAKFDLAFADTERHLGDRNEPDAPHANVIRRRPRGVAGVIGPFNFPIHLPHGAIVAYLLAGNTVVFKPSPLAATVCERYVRLMQQSLPPGVFEVVQGGAVIGAALATHPAVRSVHFTGSVPAGRAIAQATAGDIGKDVALELGGKNAAIILADADLDLAASAVAEAMCLTTGQRCNSTSRVFVSPRVDAEFIERLLAKLAVYVPGDPLLSQTKLGPLVSLTACERYAAALRLHGNWIVRGALEGSADGKIGHYVIPAVVAVDAAPADHPLLQEEWFAPILTVVNTLPEGRMIDWANATPFGLTASIFTADRDRFFAMAERLDVGNVYQNLPTTFSPGHLPFGGFKQSGNGRAGGRGFVRFVTDEQVLQMR